MKDIIIGDEHGRYKFLSIYNQIKDRTDIRYIISTGDYFDPYVNMSGEALLENFYNIIDVVRKDPRVKLLLGNHDIHYIVSCDKSRFDYFNASKYRAAIKDNMDLFNLVIDLGNKHIVSHAGITKTWLRKCKLELENINDILKEDSQIYRLLRYDERDPSGYGEMPLQSCVWVRPNGLMSDAIDEYTQIVGHSFTEEINYFLDTVAPSKDIVHKDNFYFVETGDNKTFLELEI